MTTFNDGEGGASIRSKINAAITSVDTGNFAGRALQADGLTFPATKVPSSNPNTLDDYEEGTFTPTIIGTTTAGVGTYTTQEGQYTKIGNCVSFALTLNWSAHTGTGNMRVAGLPFVCDKIAAVAVRHSGLTLTAGNVINMRIEAGTTEIPLGQVPTGGGSSFTVSMDSAAIISVAGQYSVP
jgi:hypothetical protein